MCLFSFRLRTYICDVCGKKRYYSINTLTDLGGLLGSNISLTINGKLVIFVKLFTYSTLDEFKCDIK